MIKEKDQMIYGDAKSKELLTENRKRLDELDKEIFDVINKIKARVKYNINN